MLSPSRRRSDRVSFTVLLEISGTDSHGEEFKQAGKTLIISRRGAMIVFGKELTPGQQIHIQRKATSESRRQGQARVVNEMGRQRDGFLYSIEILNPEIDLWGVDFPAILGESDAVAKMLLECTYCHGREVAHLSEIELRAFETNRGIARHCKTCSIPSIWSQVPNEDERKMKAKTHRASEQLDALPKEGEHRERQRLRLQTRLTACIRQSGADDELAVCEDISPLGMSFRSKRRFDTDATVEVAVPYSPETANIFLPARIVYSEEIPKAGLFRHGTEYRRIGPRAR